jgi:hypothetical protein
VEEGTGGLISILRGIWEFFGKNKDHITAIAQTALVVGGVLGLYKYFSDDRLYKRQIIARSRKRGSKTLML